MRFYEEAHKYIENNQEYIPVTYFLKSYQPWVDWDKEAEKKAKKLGITKEALLKQWADKRDKAAAKGTKFHKMMEDKLLQDKGFVILDTHCPVIAVDTVDGIKEDSIMKLEDNSVYPEKMAWSQKYRICGTADLVKVVNGRINIEDYKTNEKLEKESWKHPLLGSRKLKAPVQTLDDCNFNIYQLQLNVYMYMLLQQNRHLKIGDMTILHIIFNEDDTQSIVEHPVKDLQKEVRLMLESFKAKKGY